jgi:hypothetical protein
MEDGFGENTNSCIVTDDIRQLPLLDISELVRGQAPFLPRMGIEESISEFHSVKISALK